MFADQLTQEQRQVVFDLAANLAAADNDVSEEEIQYLKDFSDAYGIEFDLDKADLDINNALSLMDTKKARVITLQELIKLSYKDGHYGREEQEKVLLLAQKMGLNNTDFLMRIENWVRQGFDWVYEGEQMLEGDD
ncbi:TerB family tellurite resistance protein [Thiomicrorhabdus sp. 6S2-11]|jgi:tellurite resistance protein|uniref:TerB family tellurite resistance protein n=1 Tax=Thiomicrorhabdus marina TaxID=2818442 RepID=A0ABS3Q6T9_9GAMM|nr:TerB family tellurite resistance protein [Thiomicrorhabdus marina]MBO1928063.1 TerB family tellurite resistance protein [Thiomicrorhabdus marina]